jgi:hypothetical protein
MLGVERQRRDDVRNDTFVLEAGIQNVLTVMMVWPRRKRWME